MTATVTVLVPTYNHKDVLSRSLDSILCQKTDFDFDVLVVDDASTDGTSDVVREYGSRYGNIKAVVREKNLGVARNIGTAYGMIDSEFFIITEGDDYWTDDRKLQLEVDALRAHPQCIFCAHRTKIVDNDGKKVGVIGPDLEVAEKVCNFKKAPFCHTSSRLYRNFLKSMTEKERLFVWRDTYIHYAALDKGPMVYLNREMSVYCWTGEGIWTSRSSSDQADSNRTEAFLSDQFLGFSHTLELRKKYLPERPRRLFSLSLPYSRKWKIRFSVDRVCSCGNGKGF